MDVLRQPRRGTRARAQAQASAGEPHARTAPPKGGGFVVPRNRAEAYVLAEQQERVAWYALETTADLAATLAEHEETAAMVAHATGVLVDRIELAMHFVAGAPAEVEARARMLWRELQALHGLLVQSLDGMIRREARAFFERGTEYGVRQAEEADYYAVALGGALIGLRHFDPGRGVHAATYLRRWVQKALGELGQNIVGPLTVSENGIESARRVRKAASDSLDGADSSDRPVRDSDPLDPSATATTSTRAHLAQSLVLGAGYVREQVADDMSERVRRPDELFEEREGAEVDAAVLHATLAELDDQDPVAARAVRRAFGLLDEDADQDPPGGRGESIAYRRGMAWLRVQYGARPGTTDTASTSVTGSASRRARRQRRAGRSAQLGLLIGDGPGVRDQGAHQDQGADVDAADEEAHALAV